MTEKQYLISRKLNVLNFADQMKNISEACRRLGVSRQHYYDIKHTLTEEGVEGLMEKTKIVPILIEAFKALYQKVVALFESDKKQNREIASLKEENVKLKADLAKQKAEQDEMRRAMCLQNNKLSFCR